MLSLPWIIGVFCLAYFLTPVGYSRLKKLQLSRRCSRVNVVALTFDDGPGDRLTRRVLQILGERGVKATFFLSGRNIHGRQEVIREIARNGHEIASHGFNHRNHWKVSPLTAIEDMKKGWRAIDAALGEKAGKYPFRPPYGKLNIVTLVYLLLRRVPICYWTIVSGDTWPIAEWHHMRTVHLLSEAGGGVVLIHDFDRDSADKDPMILESIEAAVSAAQKLGMTFCTFSEIR